MPALTFSADGVHRCTGCNLCVEICPSRSLSLLVSDAAGAAGISDAAGAARAAAGEAGLVVSEFALEVGGCIGCGRCVEECPEEALEMHGTPVVAIALRSGGPPPIDLLDRGAARR
jgi:formate hydrogenlyase subunit 6/NADH:ubiquinone oxidoreductase subunit I